MQNGIQFDNMTRDYGVWVRGECQGYRATCAEALELLDECEARYARYERTQALAAVDVPCPLIDEVERYAEVWEVAA